MKNRRMILVIDTETTGLPKKRNAKYDDMNAWENCRIVEIAWQLYTKDGILISQYSSLIKPNGYQIPEEATRIHGISNQEADECGVPLQEAFHELQCVIETNNVYYIIAHNMEFDDNVIQSELYRLQSGFLETWQNINKACTMVMTCKPNQKWKKLVEAYKDAFGEEPQGNLHRALDDTDICAKLFFKLISS